MDSMIVRKTEIPDVLLIAPQVFEDARGFFMETFQEEKYASLGITGKFVQDNHSGSRRGTLRGLHYQIRQPQGKLVRVVAGEVFDVVVDIRRSSATFGKWAGAILSAQNKFQLWVPPGFAHGFYVVSDWAELIYKATEFYAPAWDRTLLWNDPAIRVDWPLAHAGKPLMSARDVQGATLAEAELFD